MKRIFLVSIIILCTFTHCKKPGEDVKVELPVAPTNLVSKMLTSTIINLSWSDNSNNETGFKIERKTGSEAYKMIHVTVADIETYNDTDLKPNTKYNYRIFAFNSAGSTTSNEITTTTDSVKLVPNITTTPVSSITTNSAISGGNVVDNGGSPIISRGIVWSTSTNPTISLSTKTADTTLSSAYMGKMTGLSGNTTYYVKAYATNSIGTGYGAEIILKTINYALPTFSDSMDVIYITSNSAEALIGITFNDGGTPIISRGIVWSTTQHPTSDLSTKIPYSENRRFNITGLASKQIYYIREYATNIVGTSYGREIAFTTLANQNTAAVGDLYNGGIVFYILKPGDIGYDPNLNHGLIIHAWDASFYSGQGIQDKYFWGSTINTNATDTSIGKGFTNTNLMISLIGYSFNYSALGAVRDNGRRDYPGWHLPDLGELNAIYSARKYIPNLTNSIYWSSSEVNDQKAYCLDFNSGNEKIIDKSEEFNVRAIRSF